MGKIPHSARDRCNIYRQAASIGVLKNGDCRLTNFTKNILSPSNENAIIEYNMKYNFIIFY